MTRARSTIVSVADTPYYHCIGRCVRRAFLCGRDPLSGRNFDHRKQLIRARLALLTDNFAIDICAYALMSNHYHLVLRLDPARACTWSALDVVSRWCRVFGGPLVARRFLNGEALPETDLTLIKALVQRWRSRLVDLSWFMRSLNEYVARMANVEDGCKGRFWEGRFKSQALLDDAALLTAMAYVDLNPVRAGITEAVAETAFTSVRQRLDDEALGAADTAREGMPRLQVFGLALESSALALPFTFNDYLDLVETTGRSVHPAKFAAKPDTQTRLLAAVGLRPDEWIRSIVELHERFRYFIASPSRLRTLAESRGWHWVWGRSAAVRLYRQADG